MFLSQAYIKITSFKYYLRLEERRGYNDGNGVPLTSVPATVEEFRAIIAKLKSEVADLNNRVSQLESKQRSWLDRILNG